MRILDSLLYVLQLWYRLKHSFQKCYPSFVVHYAVRADGRQHLISGPSRVKGDETLMVVHYQNGKKLVAFADAGDTVPLHGIMGLIVVLDDISVILDPACFMLVGNVLFTPAFNYWLCRTHGAAPKPVLEYTYIDHNAEIFSSNRAMRVLSSGVQIE
jgi:hypothetical protein